MGLLKPVQNQSACLKAGVYGTQGAGKTYTATSIAIGLHKHIKSEKPIAFFDTETGSDFVLPRFKEAKIELLGIKGRAFKDLITVFHEAEQTCDILIIDSLTHVWREIVKAYKNGRKFLRIQDWGPIKENWQTYTDLFVNSNLHVIVCARSGNVYEDLADDNDSGGKKKWEAHKVGTKMAAEGEAGYEASLLLEMSKVYLEDGGKYARQCDVLKDRFAVIDSAAFTDPTFENFLPHIELLNIGGKHFGVDTDSTSHEIFAEGNDGNLAHEERRRKIALEKIEAACTEAFPSTAAPAKRAKIRAMKHAFGTTSWKEIQGMTATFLEEEGAALAVYLGDSDTREDLLRDELELNHIKMLDDIRAEFQAATNGAAEGAA